VLAHPRGSGEKLWLSSRRLHLVRDRKRDQNEEAVGLMSPLTDVAGATIPRSPVQPSNEALQQTKPGITTHGPVFAAERRCSPDFQRPLAPLNLPLANAEAWSWEPGLC